LSTKDINRNQTYTLQPEVQHYFLPFLFSAILIPVFFIGMFVLYYYRTLLRETYYEITNDSVTRRFRDKKQEILISSIENIRISYNRMHKRFGLGNVHLAGSGTEVVLEGVNNPEELAGIIQMAADQEKRYKEIDLTPKSDFDDLKTGAADQMNNLVGLWQQGLINNDEFEAERRKYVKGER
jgi:hypothetical protein